MKSVKESIKSLTLPNFETCLMFASSVLSALYNRSMTSSCRYKSMVTDKERQGNQVCQVFPPVNEPTMLQVRLQLL